MTKLAWSAGLTASVAAAALMVQIDLRGPERQADPGIAALTDPALWTRTLCSGRSSAANPSLRLRFASALAETAAAQPLSDLPPVYEGLGDFSYPISTTEPLAQTYFDQGLKLSYAFNHFEAGRSFRAAQIIDPHCAICAWGEALVLGPNINIPMGAEAVEPAFAAISKARALASKASGKERALITALATRYSPDPDADRAALDTAYRDAMLTLARLYPDDDHIVVLAAESIMDTQPWDYWEADGSAKGMADEAIALVETVLERNPDHIGAIHLYIHLTEASRDPTAAKPFADRLAALAPAAGHLVHMPGHTYFRIGMYRESLETNVKAVAADEAYLETSPDMGPYRFGYYPHNVHFLMVSAQVMGDKETALSNAKKLASLMGPQVLEDVPPFQAIAVAPLMAQVQFADHDAILLAERPDDRFPFMVAHWHYARALARAYKGDTAAARVEADALAGIAALPEIKALETYNFPAPMILKVAESVVRGRIAWFELDYDAAVGHLEQAAALQDQLPYTEPPFWYYPVYQSVGGVLLEAGRLEEAEKAFRRALVSYPNNGWALHGLAMTYEKMGKRMVSERFREQANEAWLGEVAPSVRAL